VSPEEQLRQLAERMDALTASNARLVRRLNELERRLHALTGHPPTPEPATPPKHPLVAQAAPPPQSVVEPAPSPGPVAQSAPPHEPVADPVPPPAPSETPSLESKLGLAWVNRMAVVTCIFAAAFFFKYAADNEWIGPSGRVVLGLLAGCAALFFAERFHARAERVYSQGLCGLGVSLLYLSFFAGFHFYQLLPQGPALLKEMERVGMILDVTHLSDQCFFEAIDIYGGPILASHHNSRTLVPNVRQLTDDQIKRIVERKGVIGTALDAWMMVPNWNRGETTPEQTGVKMEHMIDHIDKVCQLAGNAKHAAIGTDLDGGYGTEQTPSDLDTIADLQMVPDLLRKRGYPEPDIEGIMHGNWVRFFREAWSKGTGK